MGSEMCIRDSGKYGRRSQLQRPPVYPTRIAHGSGGRQTWRNARGMDSVIEARLRPPGRILLLGCRNSDLYDSPGRLETSRFFRGSGVSGNKLVIQAPMRKRVNFDDAWDSLACALCTSGQACCRTRSTTATAMQSSLPSWI